MNHDEIERTIREGLRRAVQELSIRVDEPLPAVLFFIQNRLDKVWPGTD